MSEFKKVIDGIQLKKEFEDKTCKELINYKSALKLQELVKEKIKINKKHKNYEESHDEKSICLRCSVLELQSLVDKSEKTSV